MGQIQQRARIATDAISSGDFPAPTTLLAAHSGALVYMKGLYMNGP
jgi:hypothetical protein